MAVSPPTKKSTEAMTMAQVARLLQVNYKTLREWIHDGSFPIPVVVFGDRTLRVSRTSLLQFLAGGSPEYILNGRSLAEINNEQKENPDGEASTDVDLSHRDRLTAERTAKPPTP